MAGYLPGDGVEEFKGALGMEVRRVLGGVDPEGEELGGEVAGAGGFKVYRACAQRAGDEVPGLVEHALWGVGVAVDDESFGVEGGVSWHVFFSTPVVGSWRQGVSTEEDISGLRGVCSGGTNKGFDRVICYERENKC